MIQKLPPLQDGYHRPDLDQVLVGQLADNGSNWALPPSSLRRRRRAVTIGTTLFVLGALLILLNSPFRNEFLAPGPLCESHARILASRGADRCSACHSNARAGFAGWLAGGQAQPFQQSELCLECHQQHLNSDHSLSPHNVDPMVLAELTKKSAANSDHSLVKQVSHGIGSTSPARRVRQLACSTCHRNIFNF